jgi:hypothetical protein
MDRQKLIDEQEMVNRWETANKMMGRWETV